ncbi:MAG: nucleotide exchange factor GrpE [Treponema sp.]|jgi:molecular chaperone GrpE|nr:nucleotide exchange factor GrpE [Treponema sp.]
MSKRAEKREEGAETASSPKMENGPAEARPEQAACPGGAGEHTGESPAEEETRAAETGNNGESSGVVDGGTEGGTAANSVSENAAGPADRTSPEEQIAELRIKLAELSDQYLRKAADFENFRKRMNQEKQSAIDFANQTLLLDLIPVIDDFERAIKAAEDQRGAAGQDPGQLSAGFDSLREGIGMIEKRLLTELENKWALKRFDSAGEPFDPNRHEAIMMEKSAELTDPVVAEDFIKGYTLKDRVIRPAKVKVIMPAS